MKKIFLLFGSFIIFISTSVIANSNLNEGLVALYTFTGDVADESGNGNDGVVYGCLLTKDRYDNPNSAYRFDGRNDYIKTPIKMKNGDKSISLWFKPANDMENSGLQIIAGFHDYTNNRFYIGFWDGKFAIGIGSHIYYESSINLIDTRVKWHHLVLVSQKNKGHVYQNGVFAGSIDWSGKNDGSGNYITIGKGGGTLDFFFRGSVDHVRIYDRYITKERIFKLFNEKIEKCVYLDKDSDGVIDQWDECPHTPINSYVDSKGCLANNNSAVSGRILIKGQPLFHGTATLIQSGELFQKSTFDANGYFTFDRVKEEKSINIMIRRPSK